MEYCCQGFRERAEVFHSFYKTEIYGKKLWVMDFNKENNEGIHIVIGYCMFCGKKLG